MDPTSPPAQSRPLTGSLLRILGVTFGIAVTLGNSIGAGIMRTPSQIAARLPSERLIMLAWTLGAIYSLLGAWSLAELGAMIPSSGGYYTVTRRAFGDYIGFVVGWTDWLSNCGANAVAAILIAEYSRDLLPGLSHPILTGTAVIVAIALLQWRGIRWGSRFQDITSAITALVFFVLIAAAYLRPHLSLAAQATAGRAQRDSFRMAAAFRLRSRPASRSSTPSTDGTAPFISATRSAIPDARCRAPC